MLISSFSNASYQLINLFNEGECWICYDPDREDAGGFISPCLCKGLFVVFIIGRIRYYFNILCKMFLDYAIRKRN